MFKLAAEVAAEIAEVHWKRWNVDHAVATAAQSDRFHRLWTTALVHVYIRQQPCWV